MKHIAIYNGKKVEFDFDKGERICLKSRPEDKGTVKGIEERLFVSVEWDDNCKDRLGGLWTPMELMKIPMPDESTAYGTDCRTGGCE